LLRFSRNTGAKCFEQEEKSDLFLFLSNWKAFDNAPGVFNPYRYDDVIMFHSNSSPNLGTKKKKKN